MGEVLQKKIEDYENETASLQELTGQRDDLTAPKLVDAQISEAQGKISVEVKVSDASECSTMPVYSFLNGLLLKKVGGKQTPLANFRLQIVAQHVIMDEGVMVRRDFQVNLHLDGKTVPLMIPSEDFCCHRLINCIVENVGSDAIIYGNHKDLQIAAQELSPLPIPVRTITTSMGYMRVSAAVTGILAV